MDIKAITADVITGYIRKMARKKNKIEDKVQLVLYLKSQKEVGVYLLDEYKPTDDNIELKDVLGLYSMSYSIVNGFISKSLQNFAQEACCDINEINCMLWLEQELVSLCVYKGHTPFKRISIDELLKE